MLRSARRSSAPFPLKKDPSGTVLVSPLSQSIQSRPNQPLRAVNSPNCNSQQCTGRHVAHRYGLNQCPLLGYNSLLLHGVSGVQTRSAQGEALVEQFSHTNLNASGIAYTATPSSLLSTRPSSATPSSLPSARPSSATPTSLPSTRPSSATTTSLPSTRPYTATPNNPLQAVNSHRPILHDLQIYTQYGAIRTKPTAATLLMSTLLQPSSLPEANPVPLCKVKPYP